jgi:MYXO-CTERM domain-containing protein
MKLVLLFAATILLAGASQAATVTITAGLANQGLTPNFVGIAQPSSYFVSVGVWNAGSQTFSPFGSAFSDTGEVNGQVTATGPATFNNQQVALYVGMGASIAESGPFWVVFTSTNAGAFFPPDVSAPSGVTFAATAPAVLNVAAAGLFAFIHPQTATGYQLDIVPEPSAALLGLLGVAGLLRRQRRS